MGQPGEKGTKSKPQSKLLSRCREGSVAKKKKNIEQQVFGLTAQYGHWQRENSYPRVMQTFVFMVVDRGFFKKIEVVLDGHAHGPGAFKQSSVKLRSGEPFGENSPPLDYKRR